MSEYNIQMNKYNALNAEYDQLYPNPMKHANTHAKDGSDPITPASIGAYTKTEADALLANKLNTNLGYIGGDFANLDTVKSPGDYVWLDTKGEIGFAGALYTVRVAAPKYGSSESVTQMMHQTYPAAGWSIKARSYYYASGWTPWRTLATATDLDTKVSKSGDTMTGQLFIQRNGGKTSLDVNNVGAFLYANNGDSNVGRYLYLGTLVGRPTDESSLVLNVRNNNGYGVDYSVLHTGNAQTLGFTKIATGSYVGTGTVGREHPTVLTFNFAPKFLILVKDEGALPDGSTLLSRVGAYSIYGYNGFYHFYTYSSGFACTLSGWGTNTLSYYAYGADATYQFNASGNTYYYMALG